MKILITLFLLFSFLPTFATWSIIIVDPKTKQVGIAGASCSPNCYGIGTIVPNVGAVMVQAMSNGAARSKGVEMIIANAAPAEVIAAMRDPQYDPENQQYAVVTLRDIDVPATYTGTSTHTFNGTMTASGVSVQGNTLTNENEIKIIFDAVVAARAKGLSLPDVLMLALEAGSVAGGDSRCGEQRATSAFIIVANPDDKEPYLDLSVFGQRKGGQNAVQLLRKKLEKIKD